MIWVVYSILLALEILIVAAAISNAIPYNLHTSYYDSLLLRYRGSIRPDRDLLLYAVFIGACFLIQGAVVFIGKHRLWEKHFTAKLRPLLWVEGFWVTVETFAAFHMIMDQQPSGAKNLFYGALILSALTKIFWGELCRAWPLMREKASRIHAGALVQLSTPLGMYAANALAILFIFLVIYIPNPEAVVAWMYMGEQFHQWDGNFMGVNYGLLYGLLPDVDIISTYGFGFPVMIAGLMKLFGGFGYANALRGLFWVGIVYYCLWYLLLRRWLVSGIMAFAAIILGMRAQMFDPLEAPIIWQQAPASVFRYCFDILFFWILFKHLQTYGRSLFILVAVIVSIAMYHMISTGALLLVVLLFYLAFHILVPHLRIQMFKSRKSLLFYAGAVLMVPVLMLGWTYLTVKGHGLTREFWMNVGEYNNAFYHHLMTFPLTDSLKRKEFLFTLGGLAYPLLYMASALYGCILVCFKKQDYKFLFAALVGIYGLCLHSYYILVATKYLEVGLPGIFLLFFWLDHLIAGRLHPGQRNIVRWVLLSVSLLMLLTSPMFRGYPNWLNVSRNPIVDPRTAQRVGNNSYYFNQLYVDVPEAIKLPLNNLGEREEGLKYEKDFKTDQEVIDFYHKETDFSKDAALIDRWTPAGARVPLLSSFELLILQQAHRKPFFYYFPLLNSRPMRMRTWMGSCGTILTKDNVLKIIRQLESANPPFIFMERIFLTPEVPAWYGYQFEDFIDILRYVLARYEPGEVGQYLVVMKRKE